MLLLFFFLTTLYEKSCKIFFVLDLNHMHNNNDEIKGLSIPIVYFQIKPRGSFAVVRIKIITRKCR